MIAEISHLTIIKMVALHHFKMVGSPPSWIFKSLIFWSDGKLWRTNMCHRAKFRQNRPNGFWDITIFLFSRWPPSAILDFEILKFLVFRQFWRAKMHHHTKFHQNRSNGCRDIAFNVFQNGGRPPSWIFIKLIYKTFLRVRRDNVRQRAKFRRNRSNHCWNIAIYPFFQDGGTYAPICWSSLSRKTGLQ